MIRFLMKKYALSRQGAKDLITATIACAVHNFTLMLPVSLLYFLVSDLMGGSLMLVGNLIRDQLLKSRDWPFGAALSVLLMAVTVLIFGLYRRSGGKDLGVF